MSKNAWVLGLLMGAVLWVLPAVAGEAMEMAEVAQAQGPEQAVESVATSCGEAELSFVSAIDRETKEEPQDLGCPDWRCTRGTHCGWECGDARPTCSNPTGGVCAGWCICY